MDKYAVIVAGGEGTRAGGTLPKQLHPISGRPLLWWTLKAFSDEDPSTRLIVVMNPRVKEVWNEMVNSMPATDRIDHIVVDGGDSRTASVRNGLAVVPDGEGKLVAVHDAARPAVPVQVVADAWDSASLYGSGVPVVPVTDSLRVIDGDSTKAVDRSRYFSVQTPQAFNARLLKRAYDSMPGVVLSDDATAFEAAGHRIHTTKGSPANIKVTNPGDFMTVERLLSQNLE